MKNNKVKDIYVTMGMVIEMIVVIAIITAYNTIRYGNLVEHLIDVAVVMVPITGIAIALTFGVKYCFWEIKDWFKLKIKKLKKAFAEES